MKSRFLFVLVLCVHPLSWAAEPPTPAATNSTPKSVYQMTPAETGAFITMMRSNVPDLRERVAAIARRNLGQTYRLNLLGEFPFQIHDAQPLYSIENSDCTVFIEHVYAMALADDWESFFSLLQRIRYKNGEISVLTRNHYTLADWNVNNEWLLRDLGSELKGVKLETVIENIDRTAFFQKSFQTEVHAPVQHYATTYVPAAAIKDIASQLKNGDCVNLIRGKKGGEQYCGHVGLITISADGAVNLLHSAAPHSVEQPLVKYVEDQIIRNQQREAKGEVLFVGMKFLRLQEDPLANLITIDGPDAPLVTGPRGLIRKIQQAHPIPDGATNTNQR